MEKRNRLIQYLITCSLSIAAVNMGVSSAWSSPVIAKFKANETNIDITDSQIAWMLSMSPPGFMAGSFISRYTSDYFGRRTTILGSALPNVIGTIIVAFSTDVWLPCVTMFLWGIGTGMISTVMNIYISEIADPEIRGTLSVITRFMFNFGSLITMSIGLYVSYSTLNYMLLALPLIYFFACFWIPESPSFFMKEGKLHEARMALVKLKGYKDDETIQEAISKLQGDVKKDMQRSSSAKELFTGRQYRKALIVAAGLKLAQMLTGGLTIAQYLGVIMKESKSTLPLTTSFIVFGALRFIVSIFSSVIADRVGRRPLLIYSFLGTAISLGIVGLYFFMLEVIRPDEDNLIKYAHVAFVCIILSNVISTLGFQSIISIIPAEIFPLNVKAVACTSFSMFGGILGFGTAKGYQAVKDVAGLTGVFWVFGSVGLFGAVFVYFYLPETKGKTLQDIQIEFQGIYYNRDGNVEKLNQISVGHDEGGEEMKILNQPQLLNQNDNHTNVDR